jgi:[methyl-Co(III) methanol-specific corrinoid protein]:coenzyme M methyltransferase
VEQIEKSGIPYPEVHRDPEKMARLSEMAFEECDWESLRVPIDICLEAEVFGGKVNWGSDALEPHIPDPCFAGFEDFTVPNEGFSRGRFPVLFEAIRILNGRHPDLPLFVQVLSPFTLAGLLFGIKEFLTATLKRPKETADVLERLTDFIVEYIQRLNETGNVIISVLDGIASGSLVSPKSFGKFVLPCYRKINREISSPMILHLCGNTKLVLNQIPDSGFRAFSFEGPMVSPGDVKTACGDEIVRIGNTPILLLAKGSPEEVERESLNALRDGVDILAPGCGLPLGTKKENLIAMRKALITFVS